MYLNQQNHGAQKINILNPNKTKLVHFKPNLSLATQD